MRRYSPPGVVGGVEGENRGLVDRWILRYVSFVVVVITITGMLYVKRIN
jgi:hypothetical protein